MLPVGAAALLTAATGASVKLAGTELVAARPKDRILALVVGIALTGWSISSLLYKPFHVHALTIEEAHVTTDGLGCPEVITVDVLADVQHGPGDIYYSVKVDFGKFPSDRSGYGIDIWLERSHFRTRAPSQGLVLLGETSVDIGWDLVRHAFAHTRGVNPRSVHYATLEYRAFAPNVATATAPIHMNYGPCGGRVKKRHA